MHVNACECIFSKILKALLSLAYRAKHAFTYIYMHLDSTGECRKMGERVLRPFPFSAHAAGYTLDDFALLDVRR